MTTCLSNPKKVCLGGRPQRPVLRRPQGSRGKATQSEHLPVYTPGKDRRVETGTGPTAWERAELSADRAQAIWDQIYLPPPFPGLPPTSSQAKVATLLVRDGLLGRFERRARKEGITWGVAGKAATELLGSPLQRVGKQVDLVVDESHPRAAHFKLLIETEMRSVSPNTQLRWMGDLSADKPKAYGPVPIAEQVVVLNDGRLLDFSGKAFDPAHWTPRQPPPPSRGGSRHPALQQRPNKR